LGACAKTTRGSDDDRSNVSAQNPQTEDVMKGETVETTLGDLIAALTEEASRSIADEKTVYSVVAYILSDLLRLSGPVSRTWH